MDPHTLACLLPLVAAATAAAQWSSDPAANLEVADGPANQSHYGIAATPDGGCYLAYFDTTASPFELWLQHLDAAGVEQWPHNGILISDHPQSGHAIFGFDLIADTTGRCVLALADARDGDDLDIHAYCITSDGSFAWGPDGVTLSVNDDFESSPVITETASGDFVFVWPRNPPGSGGSLDMQRLTAAGAPRLAAGGLPIVSEADETPGFPRVASGAGDGVIAAWVRDVDGVDAVRHVRAAAFDAAGGATWGPQAVYDAASLPFTDAAQLTPDGAGGAVLWWHNEVAGFFRSYVQRLDGAGNELFPHNGISVSASATTHQIDPAVIWRPATQDMLVFWQERNATQTQWGVAGQRLTGAGAAQWGADGKVLLPVDGVLNTSPQVAPCGDGAAVFVTDAPEGTNDRRVIGVRVHDDGSFGWSGGPLVAASTLSIKFGLRVTHGASDATLLAWTDARNGSNDVYAQNVTADGLLGVTFDPADVNEDGAVDVNDLVQIITDWGPCPPPCPSDTDGDGDVDVDDLVAVIVAWG